jgi:hypothetical protein
MYNDICPVKVTFIVGAEPQSRKLNIVLLFVLVFSLYQ